MDVNLTMIMPVIIPSLFIIWLGSLYLRKKTVVLSMSVLWGVIILMFVLMMVAQVFVAYEEHLELEEEWKEDFGTRLGNPPEFNWYLYILPLFMVLPLFIIFMFLFKNAILIYNIRDEHLSSNLNDALGELKWEYDRDFTYIHVKEPKIKIKVAMVDPMRTGQIFFRDMEDKEAVNRFKEVLISKIRGNEVKPFLPVGLLFFFMGIFFPLFTYIMIAMI
ncbi:MAG: hypothetical protein JSW28_05570 [Thermoplasmata archaeon]|nr:MAG: hypothetical protein JSW28_05570 [Thermoplasmata archaeon]